jgi:hypothetical protein
MVQASGISGDIVLVLEALVLFCIASEFLPALRRLLPSWLRFTSIRPVQTASSVATISATGLDETPRVEVEERPEKVPIDVAAKETSDENVGGESASLREE